LHIKIGTDGEAGIAGLPLHGMIIKEEDYYEEGI